MSLKEYVRYYDSTYREEILSLDGIDCSGTKLGQWVEPPDVVSQVDWSNLDYLGQHITAASHATDIQKLQRLRFCSSAVWISFVL
jgi:hypothetical protein